MTVTDNSKGPLTGALTSASTGVLEGDAPAATLGRVLVVDDERNIRSTLQMVLTSHGYQVEVASDGKEAEVISSQKQFDAVLLDVRMPGKSGLVLLADWKQRWPEATYILMSGEASLSEALDGLKLGAFDFIEKPILTARLLTTLSHAVERALSKRRIDLGQGDSIVGDSAAIKRVLADANKIAQTRARVLIAGESGTGKDLLARYIHLASARRDRPFIKINCASIPAELVESELFGHVKGAFTGAVGARRGHFECAHGGTLFLDEIGELPLAAQAKMLRTLQSGEITLVGSSQTQIVDVRVIAATNRDLRFEVSKGQFREDLYYRLAVVCLESPSLRSRGEDVVVLARHFIHQLCDEYGLPPKALENSVERAFVSYPWPGNIRELRNVVERCLILGGGMIGLTDLPPEISSWAVTEDPNSSPAEKLKGTTIGSNERTEPRIDEPLKFPGSVASGAPFTASASVTAHVTGAGSLDPWHMFKAKSEREHILRAINLADGNMTEAARLLQVERQTMYKWIKTYNIERS
ncbi:MAG: sigma-54 dependent transcriptional regulator [Proteobacteria bacterium]|nr:sigma-54 dependent transcriptional regulator [Pseudomonadota bacterium]